MEIDFSNLTMLLRNAAIYRLSAETVLGLCLDGGRALDARRLRRLVGVSDDRALLDALPAEYRRILSPYIDAELYLAENALWNAHYRRALARFNDFNSPAHSVVVFPVLKRYEMLNISRVFEGLHFGLDVRLMQSMMIGGEDV
jgi:vacuolar-type H+-ATPase subunit C/Vma6